MGGVARGLGEAMVDFGGAMLGGGGPKKRIISMVGKSCAERPLAPHYSYLLEAHLSFKDYHVLDQLSEIVLEAHKRKGLSTNELLFLLKHTAGIPHLVANSVVQFMVNLQKTRAEGSHVSFTELLSEKRQEFEEEDKKELRLGSIEANLEMIQAKQQASRQAVRSIETACKALLERTKRA
jgi:hypothetical protein